MIFADLEINWQQIRFWVDTGTLCIVITKRVIPQNTHLQPTSKVFSLYDTTELRPVGTFRAPERVLTTGVSCEAEFVVTDWLSA